MGVLAKDGDTEIVQRWAEDPNAVPYEGEPTRVSAPAE
jgi:hypothetical protein